jgi:RNA polymerase sigma factor (sigma-70 family)
MSVAWQRWAEVSEMENAPGYLFRVAQSRARPHVRWRRRTGTFPTVEQGVAREEAPLIDLFDSLAKLRPEQRAAVLMVKSYGFSYREVAELLGVSESAVTNHVHRGLARLRSMMEVQ